MVSKQLVAASKRLSWLLRHGAEEAGIEMDGAGWVSIGEVVRALRMPRDVLDEVVATNEKARFEINGGRIRAVQGHSSAVLSIDALEASWEVYSATASLWHGTSARAVEGIAEQGILPQARTHVHLAETADSPVGKRAHVDVLLEVSPARLRSANLEIYRSPNGVLLVRCVPVDCIVGLVVTAPARKGRESALRARLGLSV